MLAVAGGISSYIDALARCQVGIIHLNTATCQGDGAVVSSQVKVTTSAIQAHPALHVVTDVDAAILCSQGVITSEFKLCNM